MVLLSFLFDEQLIGYNGINKFCYCFEIFICNEQPQERSKSEFFRPKCSICHEKCKLFKRETILPRSRKALHPELYSGCRRSVASFFDIRNEIKDGSPPAFESNESKLEAGDTGEI